MSWQAEVIIPILRCFKVIYLVRMIQEGIKCTGVPLNLYRTAIRPAMLYGAECWPTKRRHVQQLSSRDADVAVVLRAHKEG